MVSLAAAGGARPAARLAPRRASRRCPGCSAAPSHDARCDRLELRAARSGSSAPPRAGGDLPEQVHARGRASRRRARGRRCCPRRADGREPRPSLRLEAIGLLEVVREYGLGASLSRRSRATAFTPHISRAARSARRPSSAVREQGGWLERLEGVHDDLRAALDWLGENASRSCGFGWLRRSDGSGTSAGTSARVCNGSPRPSRGRRARTRR